MKYFILIGFIYVFSVKSLCYNKIDSLLKTLDTLEETEHSNVYLKICSKIKLNDDTVLFFAKKAETLSLKFGDSLNLAKSLRVKGYYYHVIHDYYQAINQFEKMYGICKRNNFYELEKYASNGLANSYYSISDYDEALKYLLESLALRKKLGANWNEIMVSSNNIGLVYYQINDFKNALLYFNQALKIEEENDYNDVVLTYVNIGISHEGLKDYKTALEWFEKAVAKCELNCEPITLIEIYHAIGLCNTNLGNYDEAERFYKKAFEVASKNSLDKQLSIGYHRLSHLNLQRKDYEKAKLYADSSQQIAIRINDLSSLQMNYEYYANIYSKIDSFKNAYINQILSDSIKNLIMNEKISNNLLQIQVNNKERENLEVIALQNKTIERRTALLYFFMLSAILISVILLLLYINLRFRKKATKKLSNAYKIIEDKNEKLKKSNELLEKRVIERTESLRKINKALKKSNDDLDNFIYKISHDIRGPVTTIQGICNIAFMDVKDITAIDYFNKLNKTALNLGLTLNKLTVVNQINNKPISLKNHIISKTINLHFKKYKKKHSEREFNLIIEGDEHLEIYCDINLLNIIFDNLISNAFKFHKEISHKTSLIKSIFKIINKNFIFIIIDNGEGIEDPQKEEIFNIFSNTSELNNSSSVGLYLVKLAINKVGGDIVVDETKEGYTRFTATIPLTKKR